METLAAKIRETYEQARRSCGDALREKQLALERLRLVKEEYEVAAAAEKAAYEYLKTIREKSGGEETSKALAALEMEVNQLEKNVAFQHHGLVQNQTKLDTETKTLESLKADHASHINELEALLRQSRRSEMKRRNDNSNNHNRRNDDHSTTTTTNNNDNNNKPSAVQMLQLHLDDHNAAEYSSTSRWSTIFHKTSQSVKNAKAEDEAAIADLERIVAGYEKYFPLNEEGQEQRNDAASSSSCT